MDGFGFAGNWWRKDRDWNEDALHPVARKHQPEAIIVNNSSTAARGCVTYPMLDVATFEQGAPKSLAATPSANDRRSYT